MILLIDNYDSFTYNLYQYIGELYADVKVVRNDEITIPEIEALAPQALIFSPGPGYPKDAGITVEAIRRFSGKLPCWACVWDTSPSVRRSAERSSVQHI
ncbi:MAG: hypothetical protein V8T52_06340 [Ruminococcus sp.]